MKLCKIIISFVFFICLCFTLPLYSLAPQTILSYNVNEKKLIEMFEKSWPHLSNMSKITAFLNQRSKGLVNVDYFLLRYLEVENNTESYVVGLEEDDKSTADILAHMLGMIPPAIGYAKHKISTKAPNHLENYLDQISSIDQPIFFFAHPNLNSNTNKIMQWVVKNPNKLKNICFIFGAHEYIPFELSRGHLEVQNSRLQAEVDYLRKKIGGSFSVIAGLIGKSNLNLERYGILTKCYWGENGCDEELLEILDKCLQDKSKTNMHVLFTKLS
ncbi:hypothetical protein KKC59_01015, partial [bacterium]|nr:hypothetical protein [bacterium]